MSVFNELFRKLTDAYTKNPDSNIGKLVVILSEQIDEVRGTLNKIEEWRDIDKAQGTTLDLIGENVGQTRGLATDEIMRILIRARVARNLSDGTFNGIIKALAVTLNTTSDRIKIKELYDDIDDPEPAAIAITGLPLDVLNNSGLSATQFGLITQRVLPGGVRVAVIELAGTFSFSSDPDHIVKGRSVTNFKSKIAASDSLNPNRARRIAQSALATAIPNVDDNQSGYDNLKSLDGVTIAAGTAVNGNIAQHHFALNVLEHVNRLYGPVPGADVAAKVNWLKSNLSKLTVVWHGYGSSPTGNRANLTRWNTDTNAWLSIATTGATHTAATVQSLVFTPSVANSIDSSGFVHVLAYAEPSNGTVSSTINTDYVELVVEVGTETEGFADIAGTTGGTLSGLLVNDTTELPI